MFREIKKLAKNLAEECPEIPQEIPELLEIDQTESDEVIAHIVQAEINIEHDLMLKRTEKKVNQNSKGLRIFSIQLILHYFFFIYLYFLITMEK